jgi:transcription antitermination factor NusG
MYWACARTQPNREHFACSELGRRGFEVYCLRVSERVVRRGTRIVVIRSLFANYLFIQIEAQFYSAMNCPGVVTLLLDGERPAKVPPTVITDLRSRERNGLIVLPRKPLFRPGDTVKVVRGPLAGLRGLYQGQRAHERVAVLLALLGRIVVPEADIEKA